MHNVTLQVNFYRGDRSYAHLTVPPLVEAHQSHVDEKIAVVDCCRPQKTYTVDPGRMFPEPGFSKEVQEMCAIAEGLKAKGYFDRIIYMKPDSPLIPAIARKYFRNVIRGTHDDGGTGFMSYLVGLEEAASRFVLHYDADMLLHQDEGYDWSLEAKQIMEKSPLILDASPRISPPLIRDKSSPDIPSLRWSRNALLVEGGWRSSWFSARVFLIDREKLTGILPLLQGKLLLEVLMRKCLNRRYPLPLEMIISQRARGTGVWRLVLKSKQAWVLHPEDKTQAFLEILPQAQDALKLGKVPERQRGQENMDLPAWKSFL